MSTADKLSKLLETKEAIKQAIIDKGGTVGDVFADYPAAIQNIQSGSGTFVVPAGMKFGDSEIEEFPDDWDWSEVEQAADHNRRFNACKLISIPKLTISNATDTSSMFSFCSVLTEIDTTNWNTSKVTNMNSMFDNCSKLSKLDLSKWDVSKVTNMQKMFNSCNFLKSVRWGEFDTRSNKDFRSMFYCCYNIESIPELDCSNNTSTYSSTNSPVSGCNVLRDFGGLKGINKSIYFSNNYCLSYESLLNVINGLADGVSGQTLTLYKELVDQLSDDDIAIATSKGWSVSPAKTILSPVVVTNLTQVPSGASVITPKTYDFSQYTGIWGPNNIYNNYTLLPCRTAMYQFEADISNTTDASYMLSTCEKIRYVVLHNTHNVTNMQRMFYNSKYLVEVHMTGDVSNVENVTGMFEGVTSEGTFYYNPAYDYSAIIAELPTTWTAVPLTE